MNIFETSFVRYHNNCHKFVSLLVFDLIAMVVWLSRWGTRLMNIYEKSFVRYHNNCHKFVSFVSF